MKRAFLLLLVTTICISCMGDGKKVLTSSSGRINDVKVVVPKEYWESTVGDALRDVLAVPVDGLPQDEPLFTLSQIEPAVFTGFLKKSRNYVQIEKSDTLDVRIDRNVNAAPQTAITVSGSTENQIADLIRERGAEIIAAIREQELSEKQGRIMKSLKKDDSLERNMGVSLRFPTAYRYASEDPDFFWMRKDLKSGDMNITVYEVPLKTIDKDTNTIRNIVRMRDSIGGQNIPVDDGRFITERAYTPFLFETEIDGHFAYETKGTWEVDGRFMAGPFLNYAVRDEENNRYVILEGFIFSPSVEKRDNVFEIEAILRSARLIDRTQAK